VKKGKHTDLVPALEPVLILHSHPETIYQSAENIRLGEILQSIAAEA
jgi:proteasome lid subunit RPN8/RPN11